ncbi:DUF3889 domain-containing protein [Fictibacillus terranigra]|uniref:DUF3889 domain-containing protein n=1 Tax=Fictibacillus terranigra TaxID=3058424 RepID=A0ABT8E111_9BACL|nr:DUF3889 domain-containing protein [Fictibacillus sp. CENA-BCM004]MDN4071588.1 DUF3889 domain-containing protein [Fictibacillus sp. CENA-BCM004]
MKLNKTGFLFAFFLMILGACMNNNATDRKNNVEPHQTGYYEDQNRNNGTNMSTEPMRQDYAKWGKIALERTKEKYPNSTISDYQYDTRRVNADGTVIDFFDFIVTENRVEKDVKVKVLHDPDNGKLISVGFEEIS